MVGGVGPGDRRTGRVAWAPCPDWPALQNSSLYVGSDLLKFEEPVNMRESGTFFFRTPKVRLPEWTGQAAGARLPAELQGWHGGQARHSHSAEIAGVAGRAVWLQSVSVSPPPVFWNPSDRWAG